jgi:hypothetical protein
MPPSSFILSSIPLSYLLPHFSLSIFSNMLHPSAPPAGAPCPASAPRTDAPAPPFSVFISCPSSSPPFFLPSLLPILPDSSSPHLLPYLSLHQSFSSPSPVPVPLLPHLIFPLPSPARPSSPHPRRSQE